MILTIKRKKAEQGIALLFILLIVGILFFGTVLTAENTSGATNVTNKTVLARVNVTNTEPNVTSVTVDDATKTPVGEIDLTANNVTIVTCNATVFDFNGWQDINSTLVNATFHIQSVGADGAPDNNHRYRNDSCGLCEQGNSATQAFCFCNFPVQYYANDSNTWLCNISVRDRGGHAKDADKIYLNSTGISSTVTVTKLLAIDTALLIDYGNLSVTQTSAERVHNVTNVGNININLSLRGYGGENETAPHAKNYTMICQYGNISWDNQRYLFGTENTGATTFASMFNLTNQTRIVNNSMLPQRIDDANYGWDRNTTLWRLRVPLGVGGICNGTIIFGAVDAEV